jgi:hypothetical protein
MYKLLFWCLVSFELGHAVGFAFAESLRKKYSIEEM